MHPDRFDTMVASLAGPATTRRQFGTLLTGAATALFGVLPNSEAKKKKQKKKQNNSAELSKPAHVAIGVYMPRVLDDASVMDSLNSALGRSPDYVTWYETWSSGHFGNQHRQYLRTIEERNLVPVISWDPYDPKGHAVNQSQYALSNIYGGSFNSYIDSWAEGLADYGDTVFIIFAHEMNGDWFPWGVGVNGNSKSDFVQAWRHVQDRFRQAGANNVRWVWMPNKVYDTIPASLEDVYPGDDYVDWFGMNGYNWGTSVFWESCPCRSKWESFSKVFGETYRQLTAIGNKPIMIGETASSDESGKKGKKGKKKKKKNGNGKKKAQWIRQAMLSTLPTSYPQVRAFTWFNAKATGLDTDKKGKVIKTAAVDWRFSSSKKSRKAFSQAVTNAYYGDSLRNM